MKKVIMTDRAPAPVGPYSQAIEVDGTLYCSGQISIDPSSGEVFTGDIQKQAQMVMKNVEAVLAAADMTFGNVVKTTIFLTDMADFAKVNEVYASCFTAEPPARSCVAVASLPKGVNVEVEVLARR
ncbi:MAG: RidA family protein [Bdellovibrionaceae bacterium]|nr:RidA family protein [Bdellovibrionales bacterium]MCB9083411.1 RidA family protein [Pseudobdellovibrionaceae bacterium]